MTLKERVEKYAKGINEGGSMKYLEGGLGDCPKHCPNGSCTAIVEEEIFPEEGGSYIRILGNSYLFKGCPVGMIPDTLIELYGLPKKMVSKVIVDILNRKLLLLYFFFFWLLQKRKFYAILEEYITIVHQKTIGIIPVPEKRYNRFATELLRTLRVVCNKGKLGEIIQKLFEVVIFLLEFDTAYRLPLQDALSTIDKSNPPIKEFKRLALLLEDRYQTESEKQKCRSLLKLIPLLHIPYFKRLLINFFKEIDVTKLQFDEDDHYYNLRKKIYNFDGRPFEDRLKEAKKLDKEKGHIIIKVNL